VNGIHEVAGSIPASSTNSTTTWMHGALAGFFVTERRPFEQVRV
jgi:hypothetical protein